MRLRRRGGRKRIVAPDDSELAPATNKPQPDGTLVKALARAWRWQRLLDEGVYTTVSEIGDAENISKSYIYLFRTSHWQEPPEVADGLRQAVTAKQAIGDLPPITSLRDGTLRGGPRKFDEPCRYRRGGPSNYARDMRSWPGFEAPVDGPCDHVIRYLPRDWPIFERMRPGDEYPKAHEIAEMLFQEQLRARRRAGEPVRKGSRAWEDLRRSIVPPYRIDGFPNKWWKLDPDRPSRTLMAHLGKDGYSHIHYDGQQARTISVREAARLQSFPDGFVFNGSMNSAFRQIVNAVPPLMAYQIALTLKRTFQDSTPSAGVSFALTAAE
jgi:DNA (cytosine-5)-methyltransferase 1